MDLTSSGPLLRVQSGNHSWGVRLEAVERVTRPGDSPVDRDGAQALIHDDVGPVPLLSPGGRLTLTADQRIVWLRTDEDRLAIAVDDIGDRLPSMSLHALPSLPFQVPPPILGLAGEGAAALAVLDLKQLSSPLPAAAGVPSRPEIRNTLDADYEPSLMLLPPQGEGEHGELPLIPAVSAAQVLAVESAGDVTVLPSLATWCLGVGWWRGEPIGVYDVSRRLSPDGSGGRGRRWLIAATPGGGRLALQLDGRCTARPLPERATVEPAQGALADAIYGLFRTEQHRLALLDLERWQRAG
ncbi:MAG: chemotaxis protein CheW [Acidobacteriota bacterium]